MMQCRAKRNQQNERQKPWSDVRRQLRRWGNRWICWVVVVHVIWDAMLSEDSKIPVQGLEYNFEARGKRHWLGKKERLVLVCTTVIHNGKKQRSVRTKRTREGLVRPHIGVNGGQLTKDMHWAKAIYTVSYYGKKQQANKMIRVKTSWRKRADDQSFCPSSCRLHVKWSKCNKWVGYNRSPGQMDCVCSWCVHELWRPNLHWRWQWVQNPGNHKLDS